MFLGIKKRKHGRVRVDLAAKILAGQSPLRNCLIIDISETGARLAVDGKQDVPQEFKILLAPRGPIRRCRLVWRSGAQLGVTFPDRTKRRQFDRF